MGDSSFKEYARLERTLVVEDSFQGGMTYTNNPLNKGYAKTLVNFDLKNQGTCLSPRGGVQATETIEVGTLEIHRVHHTGFIYVQSHDESDATIHKYVLYALHNNDVYSFSNTILMIEIDGTYLTATASFDYTSKPNKMLQDAHGMVFNKVFYDSVGLYSSVDGNTYIPVIDSTGKAIIAHLKPKFNQAKTALTFTLDRLDPYKVKASQVINTGYNMLLDDPYAFSNTKNATGKLTLEGIIPRDNAGNIMMSADVGETIRYHLHYTYPESDSTKKYLVLWKVKNLNSSDNATVLRRIRGAEAIAYTPGDVITLDYKVAFKQYTVVVEVYYKDEVDAHTYVDDEDDYRNLKPIQSMTVSSYYTSSNNSGTNANLTMKKYNVATCTGMATWQQRMVLWGCAGAPNTLWVSQPNKPEYIPYPNNVEVFQENIVKCVPYLTNLLVFTTNKLYMLTLTMDSENATYYTTKCVQERLIMTEEDASTIQVVKNMVYFKSGNYFYMIVPSATSVSELQIAPVSNPITHLLDTFPEAVDNIVDSVYNLRFVLGLQADTDIYKISCDGYYNYLDGNTVRNVYMLEIATIKDGAVVNKKQLDFVLNYDTVLRAWTSYTYQRQGENSFVPYQQTITDSMTFLTRSGTQAKILTFVKTDPRDTFLASPTFKNSQYMDTGHRNHYKDWKKRFREIQFTVNSVSQKALKFHTAFLIDDNQRKDFYKYDVVHITDPNDVNYGLIYVERSLNEVLEVSDSSAVLDDLGYTLDFTRFPDISVSKVRFKVSGKGYVGKMELLSPNETMYELIGVNWVYRKMNAR